MHPRGDPLSGVYAISKTLSAARASWALGGPRIVISRDTRRPANCPQAFLMPVFVLGRFAPPGAWSVPVRCAGSASNSFARRSLKAAAFFSRSHSGRLSPLVSLPHDTWRIHVLPPFFLHHSLRALGGWLMCIASGMAGVSRTRSPDPGESTRVRHSFPSA